MKKYCKLFVFALLTFFISSMSAFAREMTIKELGDEASNLYKDKTVGFIFVIGEYAFTSQHKLTTQDVMLASRSIKVTDENKDGKTKDDGIYNEMSMQVIEPNRDKTSGTITGWEVKDNEFGTTKLGDTVNIKYIDYNFYAEKSEAKISVDVDKDEYGTYKNILQEKLKFETSKFYGANSDGEKKLSLKDDKLSGLLLKNKDVTLNEDDQKKNGNYFFAYVLEVPNANSKTTIKVTNLNGETSINWDNFDVRDNGKTPGIVLLTPIDREKFNESNGKIMTIVVDVDGDTGKEYSPTTYTIDLSELTFQEDSTVELDLNKASSQDKEVMTGWGYDANLNKELKLEEGNKLTGKLVEQSLTSKVAFGSGNETGYYFDFTFDLPDGIDKSKVKISQLESNDNKKEKKTFKKEEFDDNNDLTILFRFGPETEKCEPNGNNCKLYYSVDLDGEGEDYLPTIYTIDYSQVTFEKSSIFTVEGLDNNATKEEDLFGEGWYEKDGYSTKVEKVDPHHYKVTGLLPLFEEEEWEDSKNPLESREFNYYLGLLLKLSNVPDDEDVDVTSSATIKFFHDDTDDNQYIKLFKEDFDSSNMLYILKYLTPYKDGVSKTFDITVDLDGDGEDYAPYTVTIDWSGLKFQDESKGSSYEVATEDSIGDDDKTTIKDTWKFDFSLDNLNIKEDQGYSVGLKGYVKEQNVNAGFKQPAGYYIPLKIEFPKDIDSLKAYDHKWTIILNTENEDQTKEVIPSQNDYDNGYIVVLFKADRNNKKITYQIDYDGSPKEDGTGYDYLPYTETIDLNDVTFESENKITYQYKDEKGEDQTKVETVYEGEEVSLKNLGIDTDYRKFDGWYKDSEKQVENITTTENDDLTLTAHWTLDADTFIEDVVEDLNSDKTDNSDSFKDKFNLQHDGNNITINIDSANVPLTELAETSIPGTIAYILEKGEIKDITLSVDGKDVEFTSDYKAKGDSVYTKTDDRTGLLGSEGVELKQEIVKGAKDLFDEKLNKKEADTTLDQLEYENKSFTIKIGDAKDETVKLVDSEGNTLQDNEKIYTFNFDSDFAVVNANPKSGLGAKKIEDALNNKNSYETIYIDGDISIDKTITIDDKNVSIESIDKDNKSGKTNKDVSTVTATGENNYIFDVKSGTIDISNLTLSGGKKAEVKVEDGANVTVNNVTVSGKPEAGFEVSGTLNGSELTFENESYDNPIVKVGEDDRDNAKVTISGTSIVNYYIKVTKHENVWCNAKESYSIVKDDSCSDNTKGSWSDEYTNTRDKHYYLDSSHAKKFVYVSFMDESRTTVVKLVELGKKIDLPTEFSTKYNPIGRKDKDSETQYDFKGWLSKQTGKIVDLNNETASVESQWYYAVYEPKKD